jgi:acyl dehydratase
MTRSQVPATARLVTDVAGLPAHAGTHLGHTAWREMPQDVVTAFASLTEDHNPIHVDAGFAQKTPFGGTIAHGYLTLAMLAPLLNELLHVKDAALSINYGLDRLRFPAPLPVGGQYRAGAELTEVTPIEGGAQIKIAATIEVKDVAKPALVADCLFGHYA